MDEAAMRTLTSITMTVCTRIGNFFAGPLNVDSRRDDLHRRHLSFTVTIADIVEDLRWISTLPINMIWFLTIPNCGHQPWSLRDYHTIWSFFYLVIYSHKGCVLTVTAVVIVHIFWYIRLFLQCIIHQFRFFFTGCAEHFNWGRLLVVVSIYPIMMTLSGGLRSRSSWRWISDVHFMRRTRIVETLQTIQKPNGYLEIILIIHIPPS